jgi:hypothetical protein
MMRAPFVCIRQMRHVPVTVEAAGPAVKIVAIRHRMAGNPLSGSAHHACRWNKVWHKDPVGARIKMLFVACFVTQHLRPSLNAFGRTRDRAGVGVGDNGRRIWRSCRHAALAAKVEEDSATKADKARFRKPAAKIQ